MAPPWPYKDATAQELRNKHLESPIALNTITSVTDYFAAIIRALPEVPVLIGHSSGGLIVQLLLQKGMGAAGVAIHSFPPEGVCRYNLSFLKAIWETMVLFTSPRKAYLLPFRKWKRSVANGLSYERQKEDYYKYAIPESKQIIRDVFKCITKIEFRKPHVPLLFTAGGKDQLVPPSLNYCNYIDYEDPDSVTDYNEFAGHNHLVFGNSTFRKEAEYVFNWLNGIKNNVENNSLIKK
jgi:pimeloyl-ACP methyl ester carboxylesterase